MQVPPQISFHGIDHSSYNEEYIRERISRLEKIHDRIIACRVVVERPHQNRQTGNPYRCRVELSLPRKRELVASKEAMTERHVELRTVIGRAFDAMERQLRAATKPHEHRLPLGRAQEEEPLQGTVVRLFEDDGYGFILSEDGREFYMHEGAVLNGAFERLEIGSEVHFLAEAGEQGPQASSVRLMSSPGSASTSSPEIAAPPLDWEQLDDQEDAQLR